MRTPRALLLALVVIGGGLTSAAAGAPSEQRSPNIEQIAEVPLEKWPGEVQPDGLVDMVFKDRLVLAGLRDVDSANTATGPNGGSAIYRIADDRPYLRQLSVLPCQASGQVSVIGDVLIAGATEDDQRPASRCNRNGFQIIDISDPRRPRLTKVVELGCGVDAHTVAKSRGRWYAIAPGTCNDTVEPYTNTGIYSEMGIVRIFPRDPGKAKEVGTPPNVSGGCSEVFVFQPRDLMVCLFFGTFTIFDISDPVNPKPIAGPTGLPQHQAPPNYALSRGAFTWDGQYLVLGGGSSGIDGMCARDDDPSLFFYNLEDPSNPVLVGSWVMPRRASQRVLPMLPPGVQPDAGRDCFPSVNVLPMKDPARYVVTAAVGRQGLTVVDFSDPTRAEELAFFLPTFTPHSQDPSDSDLYLSARLTSAYWYNGRIYAAAEGEDVPRMRVFDVDGLDAHSVRYFQGSYSPQTQIESFR